MIKFQQSYDAAIVSQMILNKGVSRGGIDINKIIIYTKYSIHLPILTQEMVF